jgi:hypothetical protein
MSERYVICTEKRKQHSGPSGAVYYSRAFGCFSSKHSALRFESFEAAQAKVRQLRSAAPKWFIHAIKEV